MSDLIKREDAIRALHKHFSSGFDKDRWWNSTTVLFALNSVPSADRPQGEWMSKCGNKVCTCSSCGEDYDHTYEWIEEWNFCPNCGARMKGADDE